MHCSSEQHATLHVNMIMCLIWVFHHPSRAEPLHAPALICASRGCCCTNPNSTPTCSPTQQFETLCVGSRHRFVAGFDLFCYVDFDSLMALNFPFDQVTVQIDLSIEPEDNTWYFDSLFPHLGLNPGTTMTNDFLFPAETTTNAHLCPPIEQWPDVFCSWDQVLSSTLLADTIWWSVTRSCSSTSCSTCSRTSRSPWGTHLQICTLIWSCTTWCQQRFWNCWGASMAISAD